MQNPSPLFRTEAIQARQQSWLGEVLVIRPPSARIATLLALLLIAALVMLFTFGSYTRRSTVTGQLLPDKGLIKIYPPMDAIVVGKHVSEERAVKRGDVLYTLSTDIDSETYRSTRAAVGKQLTEKLNSLEREQQELRQLHIDEQRTLSQKAAALQSALASLDAQVEGQQSRRAFAADNLERYRALLARHFISQEMLQQKQVELLEQTNKLRELERDRITLKESLSSQRAELASLPLRQHAQTARLERDMAGLRQEQADNEGRRRIVVTAPEDGIVTGIGAEQGQTVNTSVPLLSLIPAGATLQAELVVPTGAAGFIRPGQSVSLRYHAYPYQKFGHAKGRVATITQTALTANELKLPFAPPSANNDPFYKMTVTLQAQTMMAYGTRYPLKAGMLLDADLLLETRKLYEWVLEPAYSITGRWGRASA